MKDILTEHENQDAKDEHVSVIYFHGIGNQRRFQETGRLIDALETYCISNQPDTEEQSNKSVPYELEVGSIQSERSNDQSQNEDVSYVEVQLQKQMAQKTERTRFRFYEVYWAPLAAKEVPPMEVISWMCKSAFRTMKAWFISRWRSRPSIRRMALHELREDITKDEIDDAESCMLADAFSEFSKFKARTEYPKGRFRDFIAFLHSDKYRHNSSLEKSARKWRWKYWRSEFWNCIYLSTLFMFILLLLAAVLWSAILIYQPIRSSVIGFLGESLSFIQFSKDLRLFNWVNTAVIVLGIFFMIYIRSFLRKYVGDVQFWGTFEETNIKYKIRKQILRYGVSILRHTSEDNQCKRIVVISHSLGTSIAFNSLLEYARELKAYENKSEDRIGILGKFDQFVTIGSPIDKIQYFFGSHIGEYARVDQLLDDIQGRITDPPFTVQNKQQMHWINYYDVGDIISGSLESVLDFRNLEMHIDNVQIASSKGFPNPGNCHTDYFSHRKVTEDIFNMIFYSRYSYLQSDHEKVARLDYVKTAERFTKTDFRLLLLLPWLLLLITIFDLIKIEYAIKAGVREYLGYAFLVVLLWVFARYLIGFFSRHRDPLIGKR